MDTCMQTHLHTYVRMYMIVCIDTCNLTCTHVCTHTLLLGAYFEFCFSLRMWFGNDSLSTVRMATCSIIVSMEICTRA